MDVQTIRHSALITPSGRSAKAYRICNGALQERILGVLRRIDRPGVTALGEIRDGEYYILIGCDHAIDLMHSQRVIRAMGVVFSEEVLDDPRVNVT